jgi:hypothetical protein
MLSKFPSTDRDVARFSIIDNTINVVSFGDTVSVRSSLATFSMRMSIEINRRLSKLNFVKRVGITNPFSVAHLSSSGYISPARGAGVAFAVRFPLSSGGRYGPSVLGSRVHADSYIGPHVCESVRTGSHACLFACGSPLGKILLGGGDGLISTSFPNNNFLWKS